MATFATSAGPAWDVDYGIEWVDELETGETIATSTWALTGPDAAMTLHSESVIDGVTAVAWLAGGTLCKRYVAENTIETTEGRTLSLSIAVRIDDK